MSLINQVLQDLEKRHASEPELRSLPPHVRAVQGESPRRAAAVTVAVVVILVIAAIAAVVAYLGAWPRPAQVAPAAAPAPASSPAVSAPPPITKSAPPEVEAAVEAQLLPPASRLSEELSFVPESRPGRESAPRGDKPATPKPSPARIPPEFRAAIDPPKSSQPAEPAVPVVPAQPVQPSPPVQAPPRAAEPAPVPTPAPPAAVPEAKGSIDKQVREMTLQQRAEIAFRKGAAQLQDSRAAAAEASFREALQEDPNHVGARQALLGLLLDARRNDEAEKLLLQTLELNPRQPRHAMVLARLQVDRGEVTGAINTLVAALPYVQSDADYYAFLAALLQRENRHRETIDYYRAALRLAPGNALWMMGLGISLRATSQFADAREVFQRALDTGQLNGDLKAFTERQLRELSTARK